MIYQKNYITLSEKLLKRLGVKTSLIRFWDNEFDNLKPKKNAKGNRKFTPEDIKTLKLIYRLVKEQGYTLDGAKTYLKSQNKESLNNFEIICKLESIKHQLIKIKSQI